MKEFENPYAQYKYRIKPWAYLKREETSYLIFNLYRLNFLNSEDVKPLVAKHRSQLLSFYAFPLLAFPLSRAAVGAYRTRFRVFNVNVKNAYAFAATALLWYGFSKVDPFRRAYEREKANLLDYLDTKMAFAMLDFNNLLPRYWTENWVNEKLAGLHRQRNSFFTGLLYAPEPIAEMVLTENATVEIPAYGY